MQQQTHSLYDIPSGAGLEVAHVWQKIRRSLLAAMSRGDITRDEGLFIIDELKEEQVVGVPKGLFEATMMEMVHRILKVARNVSFQIRRALNEGVIDQAKAEELLQMSLYHRINKGPIIQADIEAYRECSTVFLSLKERLRADEIVYAQRESHIHSRLHDVLRLQEYVQELDVLTAEGATKSLEESKRIPDVFERMRAVREAVEWSATLNVMMKKLRDVHPAINRNTEGMTEEEELAIRQMPSIAQRGDAVIALIKRGHLEYLFPSVFRIATADPYKM